MQYLKWLVIFALVSVANFAYAEVGALDFKSAGGADPMIEIPLQNGGRAWIHGSTVGSIVTIGGKIAAKGEYQTIHYGILMVDGLGRLQQSLTPQATGGAGK